MKRFLSFLTIALFVLGFQNLKAITWLYETGGGGWGNGELETYTTSNAVISGNNVDITAKTDYTSSRIHSAESWTYGTFSADVQIPMQQGSWPAFWMLGSNIGSVGWPQCGEIDIMESVNTGGQVYGTIHWNNNGHVSYGVNTYMGGGYHQVKVVWDANTITWYCNGVSYGAANIANNINNTACFHAPFYILVNLAIGGAWPGNTVSGLPWTFNCHNISASSSSSSSSSSSTSSSSSSGSYTAITSTIQAESYAQMSGVQLENCSEGTQDVGWIDTNDWMVYNVSVPSAGTYNISYRVASPNNGGVIQLEQAGGAVVYGQVGVPNTGGWQNWTTITQTVTLPAGNQQLAIKAIAGGWNFNWWGNAVSPSWSTTIQAESYTAMSGVQLENCSDTGGGQDVGWIDANDWMAYPAVNIPAAGTYTIQYRVASLNGGGNIQIEQAGGSPVFGSIAVPSTGGWQNWTTIKQYVTLPAGSVSLGIKALAGGFNLNWFSITQGQKAAVVDINSSISEGNIKIYPTNVADQLFVENQLEGQTQVNIFDAAGRNIIQAYVSSGKQSINVSSLKKGLYFVRVMNGNFTKNVKILK